MNFWKKLSRATRFHVLFFSSVLIVGCFCFLFSQFGASPNERQFILGIGIALIPAGLIGLIHRLFFYDELRAELDTILSSCLQDAVKTDILPFLENGIVKVSRDRNEMMEYFKKYIAKETKEVIIIGSSLKGILDPEEEIEFKRDFAYVIRNRISLGVPFKFTSYEVLESGSDIATDMLGSNGVTLNEPFSLDDGVAGNSFGIDEDHSVSPQ